MGQEHNNNNNNNKVHISFLLNVTTWVIICRVRRFTGNFRCSMFRYLGETKPMSDSDSDVYRCELWYIFVAEDCVFCFIFRVK